ncbi:MAG: alpha-hydroxy acid oxidase, partial [Candidatus Dormibacteria bacterium]
SLTEGVVRRAAAAGATALVLTGDTPVLGRKPRQGTPPFTDEMLFANLPSREGTRRERYEAIDQDPSITLQTIRCLRETSGLPVLVKGVLRVDDANACVEAGAAGIVVSNHGGRQLDRAVATAVALPDIATAVGDRVPVLVDGGIRTGVDILIALALGARAVLIGRPVLWALATDGADGVAALLVALRDDLVHAMALAGVTSIADVARNLIVVD